MQHPSLQNNSSATGNPNSANNGNHANDFNLEEATGLNTMLGLRAAAAAANFMPYRPSAGHDFFAGQGPNSDFFRFKSQLDNSIANNNKIQANEVKSPFPDLKTGKQYKLELVSGILWV